MATAERALPLIEAQWSERLEEAGFHDGNQIAASQYDPYRRIYRVDGKVWKIVLTDLELTSSFRRLGPAEEHAVMERLSGVRGVPSVGGLITSDRVAAFEMEALDGTPMDQKNLSWFGALGVLTRMLFLVLRMAMRGVAHNDLVPSNVIISDTGQVGLVDFDQAETGSKWGMLRKGLFGESLRQPKGSLFGLSRTTFVQVTPRETVSKIKASRRRRKAKPVILDESHAMTPQLEKLEAAWKIAATSNATGAVGHDPIAYYSLKVDGLELPGERPWKHRWKYLSGATDFSGRRVLELGCNQGLLSTWAIKEGGAAATLGIDIDEEIIAAARLVGEAFEVPAEFRVVDLDSPDDWESPLNDFRPDTVFALNVLRWVKDKKRLLEFLGQFDELVFEGHDDTANEIEQLMEQGFTQVEMIAISERRRAVLTFRK